jgi:SHS2 domain-containing protein
MACARRDVAHAVLRPFAISPTRVNEHVEVRSVDLLLRDETDHEDRTLASAPRSGSAQPELAALLEELLYQSAVAGLALHEFTVSEVSKMHARGTARGVKFGSDAEVTGPAVKAVTRHGLKMAKRDGHRWARIIFDV